MFETNLSKWCEQLVFFMERYKMARKQTTKTTVKKSTPAKRTTKKATVEAALTTEPGEEIVKEEIVKEFLGDKMADIDDIIKNESGRFLKVEERFIDIRYENKTVIIQYKGTHCTEKGKVYKRDKTTRTDYFDLTKYLLILCSSSKFDY